MCSLSSQCHCSRCHFLPFLVLIRFVLHDGIKSGHKTFLRTHSLTRLLKYRKSSWPSSHNQANKRTRTRKRGKHFVLMHDSAIIPWDAINVWIFRVFLSSILFVVVIGFLINKYQFILILSSYLSLFVSLSHQFCCFQVQRCAIKEIVGKWNAMHGLCDETKSKMRRKKN